ncbi:hypothetical protein O9G_003680 [Rozella allomycis CSF55]|uniref:HYDIN/VesB/CFA65-like Ig-like domain-containing protein n=1 Tax=Rozella allomycis (strain CSF55) TaxID=988480 RepID=A0A075B375_ROZAC|nr:hypothetical protein O9G_003680 [Rozella allomycis CSF55]|eukprot:EPZ35421.1 hypothetical protein O9G_003680 [Rozella allomycis CSF55]
MFVSNRGTLPLQIKALSSNVPSTIQKDGWKIIKSKLQILKRLGLSARLINVKIPTTRFDRKQLSSASNKTMKNTLILKGKDNVPLNMLGSAELPILRPFYCYQFKVGLNSSFQSIKSSLLNFHYVPILTDTENVFDPKLLKTLSIRLNGRMYRELTFYPPFHDFGSAPAEMFIVQKSIQNGQSYGVVRNKELQESSKLFLEVANLSFENQNLSLKSISKGFSINDRKWLIESGQKISIQVEFHPVRPQTQYRAVFLHNYGKTVIQLIGTGASAELTIDDKISFGKVILGKTVQKNVTISNRGFLNSNFSIQLFQQNNIFKINQSEDPNELDGILESGKSIEFQIECYAKQKMNNISSHLIFKYETIPGGYWEEKKIPLMVSVGKPNFNLNILTIDFGVVYLRNKRTFSVIATNSGDAECHFQCTNSVLIIEPFSGVVPEGGSISINVSFNPNDFDPLNTTIYFETDVGVRSIMCSGIVGLPFMKIDENDSLIEYGIVEVGIKHTKSINVRNTSSKLLKFKTILHSPLINGDKVDIEVFDLAFVENLNYAIPANGNVQVDFIVQPRDFNIPVSVCYTLITPDGEEINGLITFSGGQFIIEMENLMKEIPNELSHPLDFDLIKRNLKDILNEINIKIDLDELNSSSIIDRIESILSSLIPNSDHMRLVYSKLKESLNLFKTNETQIPKFNLGVIRPAQKSESKFVISLKNKGNLDAFIKINRLSDLDVIPVGVVDKKFKCFTLTNDDILIQPNQSISVGSFFSAIQIQPFLGNSHYIGRFSLCGQVGVSKLAFQPSTLNFSLVARKQSKTLSLNIVNQGQSFPLAMIFMPKEVLKYSVKYLLKWEKFSESLLVEETTILDLRIVLIDSPINVKFSLKNIGSCPGSISFELPSDQLEIYNNELVIKNSIDSMVIQPSERLEFVLKVNPIKRETIDYPLLILVQDYESSSIPIHCEIGKVLLNIQGQLNFTNMRVLESQERQLSIANNGDFPFTILVSVSFDSDVFEYFVNSNANVESFKLDPRATSIFRLTASPSKSDKLSVKVIHTLHKFSANFRAFEEQIQMEDTNSIVMERIDLESLKSEKRSILNFGSSDVEYRISLLFPEPEVVKKKKKNKKKGSENKLAENSTSKLNSQNSIAKMNSQNKLNENSESELPRVELTKEELNEMFKVENPEGIIPAEGSKEICFNYKALDKEDDLFRDVVVIVEAKVRYLSLFVWKASTGIPNLVIENNSVDFGSISKDSFGDAFFVLKNVGSGVCTYELTWDSTLNNPFSILDEMNGIIPSKQEKIINVKCKVLKLKENVRKLIVKSKTTTDSILCKVYGCLLKIKEEILPQLLDFTNILFGESKSVEFPIINDGDAPLEVNLSLNCQNDYFRINETDFALGMKKNNQHTVEIAFQPKSFNENLLIRYSKKGLFDEKTLKIGIKNDNNVEINVEILSTHKKPIDEKDFKEIDFGVCFIGTEMSQTFKWTNLTCTDKHFSVYLKQNENQVFQIQNTQGTIQPKQELLVPVSFKSNSALIHHSLLCVELENKEYHVPLKGKCVDYLGSIETKPPFDPLDLGLVDLSVPICLSFNFINKSIVDFKIDSNLITSIENIKPNETRPVQLYYSPICSLGDTFDFKINAFSSINTMIAAKEFRGKSGICSIEFSHIDLENENIIKQIITEESFTIVNTGNTIVTIKILDGKNQLASFVEPKEFVIQPSESKIITVHFRSETAGDITVNISVLLSELNKTFSIVYKGSVKVNEKLDMIRKFIQVPQHVKDKLILSYERRQKAEEFFKPKEERIK